MRTTLPPPVQDDQSAPLVDPNDIGVWATQARSRALPVAAQRLVLAPLAAVFAGALASGLGAALASLAEPDCRAAIWLTLAVAAAAVPLNAAFGLAAAWLVTKFDFRGKAMLLTLIDLPVSVSPVVAGLCLVLLFGANGLLAGWLVGQVPKDLVVETRSELEARALTL